MYNVCARPARLRSTRPRNSPFHSVILHLRRFKRVVRPLTPIVLRSLIVLFTAIQLQPINTPTHANYIPVLSRASVLAGVLSAPLSIIFFDIRIFNFTLIAAIFLNFVIDVREHNHLPLPTLLAALIFHSTAVLLSTLVGRRRSISKPSALRANLAHKRHYFATLRTVRYVHILELAVRLQACILTIDHALSQANASSAVFLALPFALFFLLGYNSRRNGAVVLLMLTFFAFTTQHSQFLAFDLLNTLASVAAGVLVLCVGPGLLTIDEWLATTQQLYY
ncbi:hypothetical protein BWQ96_04491 [Gracilariopsis chorda]|uniref:Uncharacterized protein n=1 Tax=Gracilariopsis chorda TaxID=448386 RepID=A0A2V3IUD8_9FLOR|nr:hypothetical protein BWQ96_04491 [Gracilariopsis chorda]|eukprot:PXF45723.1 hypothetical protein BWQ96_04491 [Gracilariopsis chorda]